MSVLSYVQFSFQIGGKQGFIGTFTWLTPPGPYRATTCRGRELNYGLHTYFFDHTRTWRISLDEWSAHCRVHLRYSTNMKDNTHQAHTQSSQQGEYGMMIKTAKWYSGTLWGFQLLVWLVPRVQFHVYGHQFVEREHEMVISSSETFLRKCALLHGYSHVSPHTEDACP